jgi:hypothetical protein
MLSGSETAGTEKVFVSKTRSGRRKNVFDKKKHSKESLSNSGILESQIKVFFIILLAFRLVLAVINFL